MKGFHHFYLGIASILLGFFHIPYSLPVTYGFIAIGAVLITDDLYQHIRNLKEPEYKSPIHILYVKTLYRIPFIQKLNEFADKLFH